MPNRAQPARSRGPSIRLLAPLILAAPVLIVSLILGLLAVRQSRTAAQDLAGQIVAQIDARVAERVASLAQTADRVSRLNAHLLSTGVYDPADLRSWLPTMQRQLTIFDGLSGICWGDAEGRAVWLVEYPGEPEREFGIRDDETGGRIHLYAVSPQGVTDPEPRRRLEYDPRDRPWYKTGAAALDSESAAAWTAPYPWTRGDGSGVTLGISHPRAIKDPSGALRGVLDTELELQQLSTFLASLRIAQTGFAFIIDRSGALVATGDGQPIVTPDGAPINAADAPDQKTRAAAKVALAEAGTLDDFRVPSRAVAKLGEERAWIGLSPIDAGEGLDWIVVTVVPERDLTARIEQTRLRAWIAGSVAVLATLLAGVGIAWAAVRPIVRLRDHVRKIGEGDLERKVDLTGARELADLSRDINLMTHGLLERARLQNSLHLAMEVQRALLPGGPPAVEGLDVAGFSKYCDETGGDYYDFLTITEAGQGQLGIALGDVMGHGIASALLMASARALLRSRSSAAPGPLSEHLAHVNAQLAKDVSGGMFMTMLLMTIDGATRRLEWSTAGQHCGVLYDPASDAFTDLWGSGLPLGIVPDASYDDLSRDGVPPGSILLLTTDGLFEARNPQRAPFGWDRIRDRLRAHRDLPAQAITRAIYNDLLAFCADAPPEDDVTFIVVKFTG